MAKKVSKFFRIGVEGDTCDGRVISAQDIQEMAETFDPRVYGCRINLEHLRGILPDGIFKRYGDVAELKAEKIDDDSALKGKWALFAKITPTDDLIAMNKAAQKVYTSMEIQPNFANTGKCYLVGLAVTDDPASLGTEYLEFCRTAKHNPLNRFKLSPENLISVATPVELEFEDLPEIVFTALTEKVKSIFGRKQASDDARLTGLIESLSPSGRRRLSAELAKRLRQSQQRRVMAQKTPDGTPYAPRQQQSARKKTGRVKRKMFAKLITSRFLHIRASPEQASMEFYGGKSPKIASVHQFGLSEENRKDGKKIDYPARPLLGFTGEDVQMIEEIILAHLER